MFKFVSVKVNFIQPQLDAQMQKVQSIVSAVRSLKQGFGLLQKTQVKGMIINVPSEMF